MAGKRCQSNAPNNSSSIGIFSQKILIKILSQLSVKAIVQYKCVSKSWKNLISDPTFVEEHLKISSQNPHLTLSWYSPNGKLKNILPFPVHRLLEEPSITVSCEDFHKITIPGTGRFIGSYNGLLCFLFTSWKPAETCNHWLSFSNPATRTISKKLGLLCLSDIHLLGYLEFAFGYVASTRTYKVVAFRAKEIEGLWKSEVKVFSLGGDNSWRNIQSFPLVPYDWLDPYFMLPVSRLNDGVHLSGTINWLAMNKSIEKPVIVSLDLSTETYKQFLLPLGFDEVPFSRPVITVLMDRLCFSYDSNATEFILWQMKEYGVQESWTQLFKISLQYLQMRLYNDGFRLACLYINGDIVICVNKLHNDAFIYNLEDKTVERIKSELFIRWFDETKDYVESLVSVH
jgi:F-box interacting protein